KSQEERTPHLATDNSGMMIRPSRKKRVDDGSAQSTVITDFCACQSQRFRLCPANPVAVYRRLAMAEYDKTFACGGLTKNTGIVRPPGSAARPERKTTFSRPCVAGSPSVAPARLLRNLMISLAK